MFIFWLLEIPSTIHVSADDTSYINITDDKVEIGNSGIERTIDTSESTLKTSKIFNKQIDMELVPQEGSEDFLIQLVSEKGAVKASDLTIQEIKEVDYKTGEKVQFTFEDYHQGNDTWSIKYNVFVEEDGQYLRSNLEISTSNKEKEIDYIDVNSIELPNDVEGLFHHPPLDDISSMWLRESELVLGQPIYANGMFFGSEFPASDTDVVDNMMQVRYYSGKDFDKLKEDDQLEEDGSFKTWNSVMGAAEGTDKDVVQTALFNYIDDIATKTEFRKQYNSWYDNMLDITDESIKESFYGTEKELGKNGVEPLDAYVVDDGWNAYETVDDNGNETGTPYENKTGFWEFNDKFPHELYPASEMAEKFESTFGLWNGPQGGYNYFDGFAELLEKNGTGHVTDEYWKAIDVGSRTYLDNLTNLFVDYQDRFDIDYWKLDGFALRPSTEEGNDHMVGGDKDMYYTSDLWEGWIQSFTAMRDERNEKDSDLFLNLTSYVNPSPWLLQWGNTVWLQDSEDLGFLDEYGGTQADQVISYRDNVYFNIFKKNDLQFPLKNVYNHDPAYGVSADVEFSDDDFRNYMMINATRGTAFWELYFSPSIMNDEKWKITADVLDWAKNNSETLENAKLFGDRPDEGGVYGYSSWNKGEGVVSFRNAADKEQTYELTMDDVVGVPTDLKNAERVQILPRIDETNVETINYGDKLKVTLEPHETRIYQFSTEDKEPPEVVSVKNTDEDMVQVKFDQRIQNPTVKVNGQSVDVDILEDYRTVDIATSDLDTKENALDIKIENIWGDSSTTTETFLSYEDGTATEFFDKSDLEDGDDLESVHFEEPNIDLYNINQSAYEFTEQTPLSGTNDFSVSFKMRTSDKEQIIINQEEEYVLEIDNEGYLDFTVGDETINSKTKVTTVDEKAHGTFGTDDYKPTTTNETIKGKVNDGNLHDVKAVREANGMLKLYIDGKLTASKYVEDKYSLENGEITLGSPETNVQIAEVEIINHAIAYDEAEKSYEKLNLSEGYKDIDRTDFKAYASSEEKEAEPYEGPVKNVLDGTTSTWWHTQYNGEQPTVPHWVTIEMPEVKSVDAYEYVSRNGNGDVKQYELQVSDTNKDDDWETIESGEMKEGESTLIEFDEPVEAKFYRLYITETYGNPKNTYASAAEIKLYTEQKGTSDFTELAQAYKEISQIDETKYTDKSLEESGLNTLKDTMNTVYNDPNSSQNDIDDVVADFNKNYEDIMNELVEKSDGEDNTPPEISVKMNNDELSDKATVSDSEFVTFTWEASDDESGVKQTTATFDDQSYEKDTDIDLAGKLGEFELAVTAEDNAGNMKEEKYSIIVTTSASDMINLVKRFEQDDAFNNDDVAHKLNLQLTTVDHFEKQKSDDKVIKHAKGLQTLLDHQKDNDLITEEVYNILTTDTDYLIEKHQ